MDVRFEYRGELFRARREAPGRIQVIDGEDRSAAVELEAQPEGSYAVRQGDGLQTAWAVRRGDTVWVRWRGRTYCLEVVQRRRGPGPGEGSLLAPMPGQVQKHLVAPGDEVAAGQTLLVLEAMKMQLEVRSPRDGRVRRFLAGEGSQVQGGAVLVELEDPA